MRTELTIDSPESSADITRLVRLAKQGCFAEQMIRKSTPIISTYVVNGEPATIELLETSRPASGQNADAEDERPAGRKE